MITLLTIVLWLLGIMFYIVMGSITFKQFKKRYEWFRDEDDFTFAIFMSTIFWPASIVFALFIHLGIYIEEKISKFVDKYLNKESSEE